MFPASEKTITIWVPLTIWEADPGNKGGWGGVGGGEGGGGAGG